MASFIQDKASRLKDESTSSANLRTIAVDNTSKLVVLLDKLAGIPSKPPPLQMPSLYFRTQSIHLGHQSSIAALILFYLPEQSIYTINIRTLGPIAFSTENAKGCSLKQVLESKETPKVCFDVRDHSRSLYSLYDISLAGVQDLQLIALATKHCQGHNPRNRLPGFAQCIERDLPKDNITTMTRHEHGLNPPFHRQAVEDMPKLWKVYGAELCKQGSGFWREMVRNATMERVDRSKIKGHNDKVVNKSRGPWDDELVDYQRDLWNDDVLSEAYMGESTLQEFSFGEFRWL